MHERGNDPQHPYRKSADTVGAVLGSYHPHGDASVYDAMVRLAQDFSLLRFCPQEMENARKVDRKRCSRCK